MIRRKRNCMENRINLLNTNNTSNNKQTIQLKTHINQTKTNPKTVANHINQTKPSTRQNSSNPSFSFK